MAVDPVCGMTVDEQSSLQSLVNGETYFFAVTTADVSSWPAWSRSCLPLRKWIGAPVRVSHPGFRWANIRLCKCASKRLRDYGQDRADVCHART